MDVCTRVYNQSAISYFESKKLQAKDDHWVGALSSDAISTPQKRNGEGRRSAKKWVLKTFYSDSAAAKNSSTTDAPDQRQTPTQCQPKSAANKLLTEESGPRASIRFQEYIVSSHAEKFKFSLVGRFVHTRPKLSLVRNWVRNKWALKGKWCVTLLDPLHILVRLENDDDMLLVWTRQKWIIDGHLMKVFKWSLQFSEKEASLAAVWVSFPFLPVVFFQEDLLLSIASFVGKVIAVDGQTRNLRRTDVARVWVEVDLSKELPDKLWIAVGSSGFWQAINYKKLPSYCANCRLQGHSTNRCKFNNINSRDSRNKFHCGLQARESEVEEELGDDDPTNGKWAQFRSLFHDADEDTFSGTLLVGRPIANGGESKRSRTTKIISSEAICERRAKVFNEEEGAFATKEPRRPHSGVQEQGPFHAPSNLEQIETGKTVSEAQNSTKVGFRYQNEEDHQVEKQDDGSYLGKKNLKSSWGNQSKKRDHKVFQSIAEENNNKSQDEIAPSNHGSIWPEQQIFPQEMKEKERKERYSSQSQVDDFFTNNRLPKQIQHTGAASSSETCDIKRYKFSDIKKMTKSFRTEIGKGGFGTVYRGKLRDSHLVAVKLLHVEGAEEEFNREIKIIGKTHHVNIVKLLGFCSEGSKRALVYEFMPNGSLDKFIDWPNSLNSKQIHQIAVGVARGLHYLHRYTPNTSVLHLDIKPANVLLDQVFCPKICDFGLAKEWKRGVKLSFEATRGTHGYIAPEHFNGSGISSKSDVYSYGVMLLEMGVGKRVLSHKRPDLFKWVRENLNHQQHQGIAKDDTSTKLIVVGLWCVQADPEHRPPMAEVVKMLEGRIEDLLPRKHLSFLHTPGATPLLDEKKSCATPTDVVEMVLLEIAQQAKRRIEGARLRRLYTLKGHVESLTKMKGLDMDTMGHQYSI
ncbi:hypothetical protein H6P81_015677 [Aristolochia fimbriata]|uniref:non-specific serine/threonine protein kinase n=1 Tax=Aristolochia fimbriata TaxID=158543 RepID=A0AAV7E6C3_ARIFI|nr:hypothetical protein H6P81_015677 [Aristolochia fimbriata]